MKVLNLLASGHNGGIEKLCVAHSRHTKIEESYVFAYSGGVNKDILIQEGNSVLDLEECRSKLDKLRNMQSYYKTNKFEVVVIQHGTPILYLFAILLKLMYKDVKIISYIHCDYKDLYRERSSLKTIINKCIIKFMMKKCDKIIVISKFVEKSVVSYLPKEKDKIRVIYNGVDSTRIKQNSDINVNETIKIIFVGRLIKEKGVQNILKIITQLKTDKRLMLTIVGDGEYKETLQVLAKELGIDNVVYFLGNRDDVPELLREHQVFMHFPECEEGFGLTIVEAMMTGLICVCNSKGAIPELIEHRENGYLIKNINEESITLISKVINNIKSDENVYIKENATKTKHKFSVLKYSEELNDVYSEVLKG